jgi:hypothetical protein
MNTYTVIDSRICVNESHTTTVRIQVTVGANQQHAIQWIFHNGRFTNFSGCLIQCKKINQLVADISGDMSLLAEMDAFIANYTN